MEEIEAILEQIKEKTHEEFRGLILDFYPKNIRRAEELVEMEESVPIQFLENPKMPSGICVIGYL